MMNLIQKNNLKSKKMKKTFLSIAVALFGLSANAQVGINTETPKTTLDIVQEDQTTKGKGFRLDDGNQAAGYVLTGDADGIGTWAKAVGQNWFYMPSAVLPTATSDPAYNGTQFSVDLYGVYSQQFGLTNSTVSVKAPGATTLPITAANGLEFFVTYFDNTVFENVAVSDAGFLTYQVKSGAAVTDATFMNIVFKVK
jgi:hypothetical protein